MTSFLKELLGDSSVSIFPHPRSILTCEPVTLAMGGMAAAGAATQIMGQVQGNKMARSVEEAKRLEQENVINETRRRATDDYLNQTRLEQEQQSQEEEALSQKTMDVNRQTQRTTATGTASAAERNVAGRTIEAITSDYEFQANEETGRLKQSQALANLQHTENIRGYKTQYTNRVTDARPYVPRPIAPVDYFGPIFGAGTQVLERQPM